MTPEQYGEIAYDAYRAAGNGRCEVSGVTLLTWGEQIRRTDAAHAWKQAAAAVRVVTMKDFTAQIESSVVAEAIVTGCVPEDILRPAAEAYVVALGWSKPDSESLRERERFETAVTAVAQNGWMHAVVVAVLRLTATTNKSDDDDTHFCGPDCTHPSCVGL